MRRTECIDVDGFWNVYQGYGSVYEARKDLGVPESRLLIGKKALSIVPNTGGAEVLYLHEGNKPNLVTDVGRNRSIRRLFTSNGSTLFQFLSVGYWSVAPAATNIGLGAETTNTTTVAGSLTTRNTCTDTDSTPDALADGDVVFDSSVSPYREKVILQSIFGTADNNGTTMWEFGLHDLAAFPTRTDATSNPSAGSSVAIPVVSTSGFSVSDVIVISGTTAGGDVTEIQTVTGTGGGNITVATLANTYTAHPTLTKRSGDMFNHLKLTSSIAKTSSFNVIIQITVRE